MCFYYLKTARCICHFEFLSCLSFLTENSNTIIIIMWFLGHHKNDVIKSNVHRGEHSLKLHLLQCNTFATPIAVAVQHVNLMI